MRRHDVAIGVFKSARTRIQGLRRGTICADRIKRSKSEVRMISTLAREAEHRSKNLLATVQAAVRLPQSDTPEGLKKTIDGRIRALANVHSTLAKTRWFGADLSTIATQEFAPFRDDPRASAYRRSANPAEGRRRSGYRRNLA